MGARGHCYIPATSEDTPVPVDMEQAGGEQKGARRRKTGAKTGDGCVETRKANILSS